MLNIRKNEGRTGGILERERREKHVLGIRKGQRRKGRKRDRKGV